MNYKTIQQTIGDTPLINIPNKSTDSLVLAKLEGNNPGGSVKDRPALNMILEAEKNGLVKPGDMLISISTSGKSKNIIKGVKTAKRMKLETAALLGRDGGDVLKEVDYSITINTLRTCRIQEMHGLIIHIICSLIENQIV